MTAKTDGQIQDELMQELRWDTRVRESDIGVAVHAGVVTLTGSVDSWPERVAAVKAAHRVTGVLDVANDIRVTLPGTIRHDDGAVARAVRHALDWDVLVPSDRITTTVMNGRVTLEGRLDHWAQYDDTERAVRNLRGVRHVENLLAVAPAPVGERSIRNAIDDALSRHVARASKHITIAVEGHNVILTGRVPSWAEHEAVEGAARGTLGVREVDNRLQIGPSS